MSTSYFSSLFVKVLDLLISMKQIGEIWSFSASVTICSSIRYLTKDEKKKNLLVDY